MYNEASTKQAKDKIKKEWDNAVSDLITGRDDAVTEMLVKSFSFDLNTISNTFGNELNKVLPELLEKIQKGTDIFGEAFTGQKLDPNAVRDSISNLVDMYSADISKELNATTISNISDLMELMEPTKKNFEQLAQSYFEETGKIPEEIASGLSSIYALEAIGMGKESLLNAMLIEADTDKEAQAVLKAMESLGIETALSYKAALELETPVVNDAVTTFIDSIADKLEEYNSTVFKEAGKNAVNSFSEGFWDSFSLEELMPSSGNYVPIDTSKFDTSWKSNLPKISVLTATNDVIQDTVRNTVKDYISNGNIAVDVNLNVTPNEREFVNVAIDGINQRTKATGKTPIALAY